MSYDNDSDEIKPLILARSDLTTSIRQPDIHQGHAAKAKARWITVEPILIFVFFGEGTVHTVLSQYLQNRIAKDVYNYTFPTDRSNTCQALNQSDSMVEEGQQIQKEVANWIFYLSICMYLPMVFTTPIFGALSDKIGRKLVIGLPLVGIIIENAIYLVVTYYYLPLKLLLFGGFASGITGGIHVVVVSCLAYITDVTKEKQRTFRLVIAHTAFLVTIGGSQMAVGYMIAAKGFVLPICLAFGGPILAFLYVFVPNFLHESFTPQKLTTISIAHQIVILLQDMRDLFRRNHGNDKIHGWRPWRLPLLVTVYMCACLSLFGVNSVLTLFFIGQPLCWASIELGIYFGVAILFVSVGKYQETFFLSAHTGQFNTHSTHNNLTI